MHSSPRSSQDYISAHVIGKIAKPDFASGPHQADGTYHQSTSPHCLNTKHMFNACPYLGPRAVSLLLSFRKLLVPTAFALQALPEVMLFESLNRLLRSVGRISVHIFAAVVHREQPFKDGAVMNRGIGHIVGADDFVLYIHVDMVFIPIIILAVLLHPPGIGIFLTLFCLVPILWNVNVLYPFVLFPAVPLYRHRYDTGVYDLPLLGGKTVFLQKGIKSLKQLFNQSCLGQLFPKQPDRLGIGYSVVQMQSQKPHKGNPIHDLVFNPLVRKIIQRLDDQDLKHHHRLIGLGSRIAFAIFLPYRFKQWTKALPGNYFMDLYPRVSIGIEFLIAKFPIKKSRLHPGCFPFLFWVDGVICHV